MSRIESDSIFGWPAFTPSGSSIGPQNGSEWVSENSGKRRKTGHGYEERQSPAATGEIGPVLIEDEDAPDSQEPTSTQRDRQIAPLRWQPGAVARFVPPRPPNIQMVVEPHIAAGRIIRFIWSDLPRQALASPPLMDAHEDAATGGNVHSSSGSETEPQPSRPLPDALTTPTPEVQAASPPALSPIETPPAAASYRQAILPEWDQNHPAVGSGHSVQREGYSSPSAPLAYTVRPESQYTLRELRGLALVTGVASRSEMYTSRVVPGIWGSIPALEDSLVTYGTRLAFEKGGNVQASGSLILVTSQPLPVVPNAGDALTLPLDGALTAGFSRSSHQARLRITNLGATPKLDRQSLIRARGWMTGIIRGSRSFRAPTRVSLEKTWLIMPPDHLAQLTEESNGRSDHRDAFSGIATSSPIFAPDGSLVFSRAVYMLDSILLAHEASQNLLEGIVQPQLMLRAISARSSTADLENAYESLEFHGDCILRFVSAWEEYYRAVVRPESPKGCKRKRKMNGELPIDELQTNRHLAQIAAASGIARYIRTQPFTKSYVGDSRSAEVGPGKNGDRLASEKVHADVIEATIAAAFLSDHGSLSNVVRVLRLLKIEMSHLDELEATIGRSGCLYPPDTLGHTTPDSPTLADQSSDVLYRPLGLDAELLKEASVLMKSSDDCDAEKKRIGMLAIKLFTTGHLMNAMPCATPEQLDSEQKLRVSKDCLAAFCVVSGLSRHVSGLDPKQKEYEKAVMQVRDESRRSGESDPQTPSWESITAVPPVTLVTYVGCVFAVLIFKAGCDLTDVHQLFNTHLCPFQKQYRMPKRSIRSRKLEAQAAEGQTSPRMTKRRRKNQKLDKGADP